MKRLTGKAAGVVILVTFFMLLMPVLASGRPGVAVSPAKYDLEMKTRDEDLSPLRVMNSGDGDQHMTINVVGLGQDINGSAVLMEDQASTKVASSYFDIEPREFDLKPGEKRYVNIRAHVPGDKQGGVYAAFTVMGAPVKRAAGPGQAQTTSNARIGVLAEIALPGGVINGELVDILVQDVPRNKALTGDERAYLEGGKSRKLAYRYDLAPVVQNTGNRHFKPDRGFVRVLTEQGEEIGKPSVEPNQNILPGYKRALRCIWNVGGSPIPDGKYYAEAHVWISGREHVLGKWFMLQGGVVARRDAKLLGIEQPSVGPNGPFTLSVAAKNTGSMPFQPAITMEIRDGDDKAIVVRMENIKVSSFLFNPGNTKSFPTSTINGLPLGNYKVRIALYYKGAQYGQKDEELDRITADFSVKAQPSWWAISWQWLLNHWWIFLVMAAVIIALLFYWQHRRHKKKMAQVARYPVMPPA